LIIRGAMTTGELVGLIVYATQILMSLNMLSMVLTMITISRASAERIVTLLDEQSTMTTIPDPVTTVADGSVRFEGVYFGYGDAEHAQVLRDINLAIGAGETIGIIGGTGSGKTSLVQLIPRLYDVTSGRVTVGGVDVRDYDLDVLRSRVAMVLQKNVLFAGTVRENLLWGNRDASDEELRRACRLAQADDFIQALPGGYDGLVDQGGSNFSGGQRQRLCIARALLKNPTILILDDSTSALDTKTDEKLRAGLANSLPGVTTLIIAQRVASVMHADRIIVMDNGRVDGYGSHEELLATNTIYQEVYHSQTRQDDGEMAN
ncbi:MAG: ABC transporter ATP-binding protein/permease, partial [Planctomycetes bacterium]|nr:ABC transporter ATP-binding protein/permease [Planctomycetota bacterium]